VIRKPITGDTAPNVEFTIGKGKQIGVIGKKRVYESTLTAKAGNATPITERAIWVVEEAPGKSGEIFMERPPDIEPIPEPGPVGPAKAKTMRAGSNPVRDRLVATHGTPDVEWAEVGLTEAQIGPTLVALDNLPPATKTMLRAIPAADVHELFAALGETRVAKALSLGPTSPMTPQRLVELRRRFGNDRAVVDMLDSAGATPKMLERIGRVADGLAQAGKVPARALTADSVVLDSNARSAIEDLLRGADKKGNPITKFADLDQNYRDAINAVRKSRGAGKDYTDPPPGKTLTLAWILDGATDLRTPQTARAEALVGEKLAGKPSHVLPNVTGLEVNRANPDYANVIDQLKVANVGSKTGALDRTIVADTLLAKRTGTPTLVSVDAAVLTNLAEHFATPRVTFARGADKMAVLNTTFPTGVFSIEILGHPLQVRFK
jgi:hypothetical protein